ncbi:divalent-cation tolerance protein CutA [Salinimonas marina]|uniref:Divalent-cation tolerance protein CutA n=1 Tax=Salinimonas marina TaxID=2785918 RepID=A0A7S9DX21_9ALTE|nr:divalent-cation tolerance protein CutA [Salinimonas marina]QPG05544.1 divalent-cation tolerance protein CutA [Salinimonas marina]
MSLSLILTTTPDEDSAAQIARALIDKRQAACVKIIPKVMSVYRWQDTVESDTESQMLIKTAREHVASAYKTVCALHPYEVPEWMVIEPVSASDNYKKWILEETLTP